MELFIDDDFNDNYDFNSVRGNLYRSFVELNPGCSGPTVYSNEDKTYSCYYTQHYPDIQQKAEINFIRDMTKEGTDAVERVVLHITDVDQKKDHLYHHIIDFTKFGIEVRTHNFMVSDLAKSYGHTSFITLKDAATASKFEGDLIEGKEFQSRFDNKWTQPQSITLDGIPNYLSKFDQHAAQVWDGINNNNLNIGYGDNPTSFRHKKST